MKPETLAGIILSGGAGSRIGGRKAMASLCGRPMIAHVAEALRGCVDGLAVVGDAEAAKAIGAESISDPPACPPGPLAGVLAGMMWAESRGAGWLLVAPCDTPLLKPAIFERLLSEADGDAAIAETAEGLHPLVSVWRCGRSGWLAGQLGGASRAARTVLAALGAKHVWFDQRQWFANVNTREDLAGVSAIIERAE